jgi:hypothetical protein
MASQIRVGQLHDEVFKLMSGKGVYDVDVEIPLSGGVFYNINTAIAATSGETPEPTFIKFSVDSTTTEVWYFQLEKPFTTTDYLYSGNWVLVLNETDIPTYFTPTATGPDGWDTE